MSARNTYHILIEVNNYTPTNERNVISKSSAGIHNSNILNPRKAYKESLYNVAVLFDINTVSSPSMNKLC